MEQSLKKQLDMCRVDLLDIKKRVGRLKATSPLVRYYTDYALIRASGTLEQVYHSIIANYFISIHNSKVDRYICKNVSESSKSAKYDTMMEILGWFDEKWKNDFKQQVTSDSNSAKLLSSAKSLVNNRHSFAHGRPTSVTIGNIVDYYDDVVVLIKYMDTVVK